MNRAHAGGYKHPMTEANRAAWLPEFIALAAIWGSSFLFMRLGALDFGALATAFLRVGMAALLMLPVLLMQGHWQTLRTHARHALTVGVLNSAIPFACFSYAVLHITSGLAGVLNASVPLFGALVAWIWLRDKPTTWRALGLAIGFGGVAMLAVGKADFKPGGSGWAVVACLLATLCYGIAASYTKRYLSGVPPMVTATGSQIGASLALAAPAAFALPTQMPGWHSWAALVALAALCTALAYVLYFRLIERAGPSKALSVTFLIPVFALAYGSVFMGEAITPLMVGAGGVIVLGTALASGLLKGPAAAR
jgi:drug/metabolite transporter (DMT)-like permease